MATVWEVVGGAERGGIIVRTGYDLSSDLADSRLATGSLVKAREKKLSDDDEVAFRRYTEKFGECYSRKAFPWFNPKPAPEEKKLSTEAHETEQQLA
ncbi:hypothetical protein AK812_SmicGene16776 [Symbiodinium microadriaticum]|uniref:Uncharacterized protein n=1 Tax=Symbiodinium microadriaticum TaxID=2951 RepID=A0A1Q9DZF8_SYMMI|nr:hypothetical protein AK812_SmicGene16776 [Symbiodinium microadriaticum]